MICRTTSVFPVARKMRDRSSAPRNDRLAKLISSKIEPTVGQSNLYEVASRQKYADDVPESSARHVVAVSRVKDWGGGALAGVVAIKVVSLVRWILI